MAAHQAPLPVGFSRQEYWSGLPLPSPIMSRILLLFSEHLSVYCMLSFVSSLVLDINYMTHFIFVRVFTQLVQFSRSVVSDSLRPHESQHTRPPCPSPTPGVYSNACPLIGDAIQPSHPLSSPSSPARNVFTTSSQF